MTLTAETAKITAEIAQGSVKMMELKRKDVIFRVNGGREGDGGCRCAQSKGVGAAYAATWLGGETQETIHHLCREIGFPCTPKSEDTTTDFPSG